MVKGNAGTFDSSNVPLLVIVSDCSVVFKTEVCDFYARTLALLPERSI
jgi:hypothetical protein